MQGQAGGDRSFHWVAVKDRKFKLPEVGYHQVHNMYPHSCHLNEGP